MEHRSLAKLEVKPAKTTMRIVEHASTPVVTRSKGDRYLADVEMVPFAKLMHSIKPKIMDQIAYPLRHHNRLSRRDSSQSSPIQMIEVSMSNQHQIDGRQVVNSNAGATDPFHHFEPERPDRIHQNVKSTPTD
jgi:hypothetical protein